MKIVLSGLMAFFLLACSENKKETNIESNTTQSTTIEKKVELNVDIQENSKEISEDTTLEIKPQVEKVAQEAIIIADSKTKSQKSPEIDGAIIYKTCVSCHGQNGEKQALNKSAIIQGWESSKTVAALQGYKDGTYGGPMKALMRGQVIKLSDAEIEAVAKYISGL